MGRVQRLLDKRIIRQVTPIFDTRALGYSSMLVAAKVDPEHPHRAAQVINEHPGVSHNYLRNHDFNLWFTIATEPDSQLGLEGTLEVLAREAGAESVRQLPTLKLFKIRMDLEMEGDTQALSSAVEAKEPIELDPQPYDELDIAVIRALQGDMPVVSEPYAPAAAALGMPQAAFLDHLSGMQERGILRRVAAILYHRRAGFSANGMGVWQVPDEQIADIGRRMAAVRGISHCYQRPTYADWPYSVFTMAHGRSKQECDAVLDAIAEHDFDAAFGGARRDEERARAKERIFSFRDDFGQWDPKNQRPELWNLYNGRISKGENVRVFPISNWTELDVWEYIDSEQLEVPSIYFSHVRDVFRRDGMLYAWREGTELIEGEEIFSETVRYRTVGDMSCTGGVLSQASTLEEVVVEIAATRITERGETRADDRVSEAAMEDRKKAGYF